MKHIPPHTVVMGEDGGIHGHPDEDQFCYDEGFGAHLGNLVEVLNPDEWREAVELDNHPLREVSQ